MTAAIISSVSVCLSVSHLVALGFVLLESHHLNHFHLTCNISSYFAEFNKDKEKLKILGIILATSAYYFDHVLL